MWLLPSEAWLLELLHRQVSVLQVVQFVIFVGACYAVTLLAAQLVQLLGWTENLGREHLLGWTDHFGREQLIPFRDEGVSVCKMVMLVRMGERMASGGVHCP